MSTPREVVDRHVAAFNAKDAAAEPWSADAEVKAPGGANPRGRDEVLGWLAVFWEAFPDGMLELVRTVESDSRMAAEGRLTGTHSGTLKTPGGDVPPTGRSVDLPWVSIYEIEGGELASEHLYFDQADFLTQLGLTDGGAGA